MDVCLRDKERFLSSQELDQTIAILNLIDCKTSAQGTLFANEELDEYKVNYMVAHHCLSGNRPRASDNVHCTRGERQTCEVNDSFEVDRHTPSRVLDTLKEPTG